MTALDRCPEDPDFDGKILHGLRSDLLRDGFLSLDRVTDPEDIWHMRALVSDLLSTRITTGEGMRDLSDDAEIHDQGRILEIVSPSVTQPRLLQSVFFQRALRVSQAVLGPSARLLFDHCIIKPPLNEAATAWHQDCIYSPRITRSARRLHWWLPLQEVTTENGCMEFVAGSHLGPVLPHRPRSPRAHAMHTDLPTGAVPVACPLPIGGATVHLPRTLHYTRPNISQAPRLAWIVQIGIKGWKPSIVR